MNVCLNFEFRKQCLMDIVIWLSKKIICLKKTSERNLHIILLCKNVYLKLPKNIGRDLPKISLYNFTCNFFGLTLNYNFPLRWA